MKIIRSILFDFFFYTSTILICLLCWPLLFLPIRKRFIVIEFWGKVISFWAKYILGLTFVVRGKENLPPPPYIVASKHQSAWETVFLNQITPCSVFVLKKELMKIPVFNWYFRGLHCIAVQRGGGAATIEDMMHQAQIVIQEGLSIIIFPEGTRTIVGSKAKYKHGIANLYRHLNVPVVPIALNSGVFWGRRSFIKNPGQIDVEILPPIYPGLDRNDFLEQLQETIETASERLCNKAQENKKHVKKAS